MNLWLTHTRTHTRTSRHNLREIATNSATVIAIRHCIRQVRRGPVRRGGGADDTSSSWRARSARFFTFEFHSQHSLQSEHFRFLSSCRVEVQTETEPKTETEANWARLKLRLGRCSKPRTWLLLSLLLLAFFFVFALFCLLFFYLREMQKIKNFTFSECKALGFCLARLAWVGFATMTTTTSAPF